MWKKALNDETKQFTGLNGSWDESIGCDIIVNSDIDDLKTCAKQIIDEFKKNA